MAKDYKLIVGLGNYPKEYYYTRHNIGFLIIDALRNGYFEYHGRAGKDFCDFSEWKDSKRAKGELSYGVFFGRDCILLKPKTYMNLSGESVFSVIKFYKIKPQDLIVIQDEMEIPFGAIKISVSRNSAGHNGIKSINSIVNGQYSRLRIGIGRPKIEKQDVGSYVLSKFSNEEINKFDEIFTNSILTLKTIL